ncbi:MAG: hypothetical protein H7Z37_17900 [Pyrinomonadaceae bacterium]|nr:hypothetical protein [Pyrinomonadaceae bacterium]
MKKILNPDLSYTFRDYFLMSANLTFKEIVAELGYDSDETELELPRTLTELTDFESLKRRILELYPLFNLVNETARRETLIAPILTDTARYTKSQIRIEYPIEVTPQLKGVLDYYLKSKNNLLIVEAKDSDLRRGFTQLAVELIAFDVANETAQSVLYGAVTTGEEWRFGKLERQSRIITQDRNFYFVPQDLEEISRILVGILELKT